MTSPDPQPPLAPGPEEFRRLLLRTVDDLAPGVAAEIGPLLGDEDKSRAWLREHGFG